MNNVTLELSPQEVEQLSLILTEDLETLKIIIEEEQNLDEVDRKNYELEKGLDEDIITKLKVAVEATKPGKIIAPKSPKFIV